MNPAEIYLTTGYIFAGIFPLTLLTMLAIAAIKGEL